LSPQGWRAAPRERASSAKWSTAGVHTSGKYRMAVMAPFPPNESSFPVILACFRSGSERLLVLDENSEQWLARSRSLWKRILEE
jgi:hypothetical protein